MTFLHQRLWDKVATDLVTAHKIRITTCNLELGMLEDLAERAPQAQILVIFDDEFGAPWRYEVWRTFQSKFGSRVDIHQQKGNRKLHAKVLIIGESQYAIVGSSNLTKAGYGADKDATGNGNQEASVRVEDPAEIKAIDRWWNTLWNNTLVYVHPPDDINDAIPLGAKAASPRNPEEHDDDPEETLQTVPDDLTSVQDRIRRNLNPPTLDDKLRDYQREILRELDARWQEGTFQEMIVLPVGAGKTLIAAEFIRRRLEEGRGPLRVLWVAHTLELAEQAMSPVLSQLSQLRQMPRITTWIGKAQSVDVVDELKQHESVLAFATVQSITALRNRLPHGMTKFNLIVVDEAHHYGYGGKWRGMIHDACKNKTFLGLTATPERLDGRELPFYNEHNAGITFRSLVEQGRLACPSYKPVETKDLIRGLGPFSRAKAINYFETQGVKYFDRPKRNCIIARDLANRLDLGPTLVFCATKDHADHLAEAIRYTGVPSEQVKSIHSTHTLEERRDTLDWFRAGRGERRILLNCKLYIEGFDMPDIRTIVLARPTLSPTYWMQMIGRGVRKTVTHDTFTIIEYTDDYEEPKWDALRASFYLLRDEGLDKWRELYDNVSLADGQQIADWNRETQQIYKRILLELARHSEAA